MLRISGQSLLQSAAPMLPYAPCAWLTVASFNNASFYNNRFNFGTLMVINANENNYSRLV